MADPPHLKLTQNETATETAYNVALMILTRFGNFTDPTLEKSLVCNNGIGLSLPLLSRLPTTGRDILPAGGGEACRGGRNPVEVKYIETAVERSYCRIRWRMRE
jgi:hypothetical protein